MIGIPSRRLRRAALAAVLVMLGAARAARADVAGVAGRIVAVTVNETTSDLYVAWHGNVVLGDAIGGFVTYYWGGTSCPGKTLQQPLVDMLQRGLDNPRIVLRPSLKNGAGANQCIVGFELVLRSEQGLIP